MVDEDQEQAERQDPERDRDRHAEARYELGAAVPLSHRAKDEQAVGEDPDERASDELVEWSLRKLRIARGLNCCETSWSETIVIEKVSPATVMSAVAIVERMLRAVGASPPKPATP